MLRKFFILMFFAFSPICSYAGGSVSFADDVAPLVARRPDLARRLEGLWLAPDGEGVRIGRPVCPALAGMRVAPYEFSARYAGGSVNVTFHTDDRFYDSGGDLVAEFRDGAPLGNDDILAAVSVREELIDITMN